MASLLKLGLKLSLTGAAIGGAYYAVQQDEELKKVVNPFIREWYDRLLNAKYQYRKNSMIDAIPGNFFDIDAGMGLNIRFVRPEVDTYFAVVRTPEEAALVRKSAQRANRSVYATVTKDPLQFLASIPDQSIECFLMTDCFSKLNAEEFAIAVDDIYRTLKPGGKVYFSDRTLHPTSPMAVVNEALNPLRSLVGLHRHDLLTKFSDKFDVMYAENWSVPLDRKEPRKNIEVLCSPVDHSILDNLFHPTKKYYQPNGEPKLPSYYDPTPEEIVAFHSANPPVKEQLAAVSPVNFMGSMYIGGILIKPLPQMTMDDRTYSLYYGNRVMHNQLKSIRKEMEIKQQLDLIASSD